MFSLFLFLGEVIDAKNRCKKCLGKKVVEETKILEVSLRELFKIKICYGYKSK